MEAQDHYAEGQNCLARGSMVHDHADAHPMGTRMHQAMLFDANVHIQRAQAHFLAAQVQVTAYPAVREQHYPEGDFT